MTTGDTPTPEAPTTDGAIADGTNDGTATPLQGADPLADPNAAQQGTLQGETGAVGQPAPGADVAPIEPSPATATDAQPGPLAPPTSPDEVLADHPGLDEQTGLEQVPDNPSSDIPANEVDTTVDTAHSWDAGTSGLDTGWFTPSAADEAFRTAQADMHGVQDGYTTVPAHLREIEDAVLAQAKVFIGTFGEDDSFRIEVDVHEFDGDVTVESRVSRKAAGA